MNIFITGASRGIGYELVKVLAARGNHRILALSRQQDKLKNLAEYCSRHFKGSDVIPFAFDLELLNEKSSELTGFIRSTLGNLDILVNNAGYLRNMAFLGTDESEAERMLKINFIAPAHLIRLMLPMMGEKGRGHVVNISSMGGVQGSAKYPGLSYYSSSKAALATLTECLAEELKSKNVAFNCIALGAVDTEMQQEAFPGYKAIISAEMMAVYLADFCLDGMNYCNGKILPYSVTNP